MAYGYLKEPVEQHKDIKLAVSVLFCKDGKAMVHSRLSDKTFEIDASNIYFKAEPNLEYSEYVTDPPTNNVKPYYKGKLTLYSIAEELGLNSYEFDIIKRVIRCRYKGEFVEDLEKTKAVIDIYLKEYIQE
jgi:hypothetical protein